MKKTNTALALKLVTSEPRGEHAEGEGAQAGARREGTTQTGDPARGLCSPVSRSGSRAEALDGY